MFAPGRLEERGRHERADASDRSFELLRGLHGLGLRTSARRPSMRAAPPPSRARRGVRRCRVRPCPRARCRATRCACPRGRSTVRPARASVPHPSRPLSPALSERAAVAMRLQAERYGPGTAATSPVWGTGQRSLGRGISARATIAGWPPESAWAPAPGRTSRSSRTGIRAAIEHARGAPALLRRALRHGRARRVVLPPARRGDRAQVGRAHAARLPLPRQGLRADDAAPGAARAAPARPPRRTSRRTSAAASSGPRASFAPRCSRASTQASSRFGRPGSSAASCSSSPRTWSTRTPRSTTCAWAKEQLRGDECLVEFRHRSWFDDEHRADTLAFLEELGAAQRRRGRAEDGGEEPRPDRARADEPRPLRALPRAKRGHVEQARRERVRALRLPLRRRGARGVGRDARRSSRRRRRRPTRCSTTTAARPGRPRAARASGSPRRPSTRSASRSSAAGRERAAA